jgi:hypothetical protein
MQTEHDLNKQKHLLGVAPRVNQVVKQEGAINKFVVSVETIQLQLGST